MAQCCSSSSGQNWFEIAALLCGSRSTGDIAAEAIAELSDESNLAEIFHEIAICKLIDIQWQTRENAALAIKLLCLKHKADILREFMTTKSDGSLLLLSDIRVEDVLRNGTVLRGSDTGDDKEEAEKIVELLYDPQWFQLQRKQLRRRLGIETTSSDATLATKYTDAYLDLIVTKDFSLYEPPVSAVDTIHRFRAERDAAPVPNDSYESWIVRILRKLVAGMLDPRWQTRQGSALGAMAIIQGLFLSTVTSVEIGSSSSSLSSSCQAMPLFLIEDLASTSLCVLMLDRFLDFRDSTKSFSPVPLLHTRL